MENSHRRVAIVHPFPNLDSVPSVCNAAILLDEEGYAVEIFTRTSQEHRFPAFPASIELHVLPGKKRAGGGTRSKLAYNRTITAHSLQIRQRHSSCPYACFIGVDPDGLAMARTLSAFIRIPIVYYSLELLLSTELDTPTETKLKRTERTLSRRSPFIVVTEAARADLISMDNDIPRHRFIEVPNGLVGPPRRRRSRYWHQRYGLPDVARVVLWAGTLKARWARLDRILGSVSRWPQGWVLILHTRSTLDASIAEDLRAKAAPDRALVSVDPVPREQFDDLVDGADIGLASYVPGTYPGTATRWSHSNTRTVGLGSGKLAYYLRSGLPVIIEDHGALADLVTKEVCGIAVDGAEALPSAIKIISFDYEAYSNRAMETFGRHFRFEPAFEPVIQRIREL